MRPDEAQRERERGPRRRAYLLAYEGGVLLRSAGRHGEPIREIAQMGEADAENEGPVGPDESPQRDIVLRERLVTHGVGVDGNKLYDSSMDRKIS